MAPVPDLTTITIDRISTEAVLFSYNQPHISNAFTIQQYYDLRDALLWAREDPDINVVVQCGKGRHYCAGKTLQSPASGGPTIEEEIQAGRALAEVLQAFPKVLIAAVHGASIGWGCTQLSNFDLVYAHTQAFFQTPFVALGFTPEGQSSWTFPRVMGRQHASRLLLGAEKVSAREMYVSGLVTQVLGEDGEESDAFVRRVVGIAKRIGASDGESLRMTKALMNRPEQLAEQREAGAREGKDLVIRMNDPNTKARLAALGSKDKDGSKSKL